MRLLRFALLYLCVTSAVCAVELDGSANPTFGTSEGILKNALADLNGDGQPERITIEPDAKSGMFLLKIGNQSIRGGTDDSESEPAEGFEIVDIDNTDRFKEVVVHPPGACEMCGQQTYIYGFDKNIRKVGQLGKSVEFPGYGIVLENDWQGFWVSRTKYILDDKSGLLKPVPQPYYFVGLNATVKKSFPIYRNQKRSKEVVANLKQGSTFMVVAAEYKTEPKWYLVKSETGLMGWISVDSLSYENTEGLPWAN